MGKFLRFISIVFMSLTAAFTLMGGAGTTCVALAAEKYDSMLAIVPYKWLYLIFVIVTTAIGVMGVRAVVLLVKGRPNAYRYAMIALVSGIIVGAIHMIVSRNLRDSSMPVDGVVYTTAITLILFLLIRIPGIWEKVDFAKARHSDSQFSGGAAAIAVGSLSLSIQHWMAPTHTMNGGVNYGDAFHLTLTTLGAGLIFFGAALILITAVRIGQQPLPLNQHQTTR